MTEMSETVMLDPMTSGTCPHCGCWHPDDPGRCAITEAHVQMAAGYVRHHPGAGVIDIAQGISPGNIQRGYHAQREASARGLIYPGPHPARYWATAAPGDPAPVTPGGSHEAWPDPREARRGEWGWQDRTLWPLHARCGACGITIGQAAPWEPWRHCTGSCQCRSVRDRMT